MTEKELKKASREDLLRLLIKVTDEMEQVNRELDEKSRSLKIYMEFAEKLQADLTKKDEELAKAWDKADKRERQADELVKVLMLEHQALKAG